MPQQKRRLDDDEPLNDLPNGWTELQDDTPSSTVAYHRRTFIQGQDRRITIWRDPEGYGDDADFAVEFHPNDRAMVGHGCGHGRRAEHVARRFMDEPPANDPDRCNHPVLEDSAECVTCGEWRGPERWERLKRVAKYGSHNALLWEIESQRAIQIMGLKQHYYEAKGNEHPPRHNVEGYSHNVSLSLLYDADGDGKITDLEDKHGGLADAIAGVVQ